MISRLPGPGVNTALADIVSLFDLSDGQNVYFDVQMQFVEVVILKTKC